MNAKIQHVPTSIITGFLGTGKTSTIQHLLRFKPKHERWAVLVNEFGSVGIDGSLYKNTHVEEGGVFVREVPGGCMCCVSGLPMQIALNVLLKLSNPHRLFIEPSGLGHPVEVLSLLKSKYYVDVLDIQKVITMIDPKQFIQTKYFEHPTYQQQLEIADTLVFNKTDLCNDEELQEFKYKLKTLNSKSYSGTYATHGEVTFNILNGISDFNSEDVVNLSDMYQANVTYSAEQELPDLPAISPQRGYSVNQRFDEGYHAISWRFLKQCVFDKNRLVTWLKTLKAERIKGVLVTDCGVIGINSLLGQLQLSEFEHCEESRLEVITKNIPDCWENDLLKCVDLQVGLGQIKRILAD